MSASDTKDFDHMPRGGGVASMIAAAREASMVFDPDASKSGEDAAPRGNSGNAAAISGQPQTARTASSNNPMKRPDRLPAMDAGALGAAGAGAGAGGGAKPPKSSRHHHRVTTLGEAVRKHDFRGLDRYAMPFLVEQIDKFNKAKDMGELALDGNPHHRPTAHPTVSRAPAAVLAAQPAGNSPQRHGRGDVLHHGTGARRTVPAAPRTANFFPVKGNFPPQPPADLTHLRVPPEDLVRHLFSAVNRSGLASIGIAQDACRMMWPGFADSTMIDQSFNVTARKQAEKHAAAAAAASGAGAGTAPGTADTSANSQDSTSVMPTADPSSALRFSDFFSMMRCTAFMNNMRPLYQMLNRGPTDKISRDEFLAIAPQLQLKEPESEFEEIDVHGHGNIGLDEFASWLAENPSRYADLEIVPLMALQAKGHQAKVVAKKKKTLGRLNKAHAAELAATANVEVPAPQDQQQQETGSAPVVEKQQQPPEGPRSAPVRSSSIPGDGPRPPMALRERNPRQLRVQQRRERLERERLDKLLAAQRERESKEDEQRRKRDEEERARQDALRDAAAKQREDALARAAALAAENAARLDFDAAEAERLRREREEKDAKRRAAFKKGQLEREALLRQLADRDAAARAAAEEEAARLAAEEEAARLARERAVQDRREAARLARLEREEAARLKAEKDAAEAEARAEEEKRRREEAARKRKEAEKKRAAAAAEKAAADKAAKEAAKLAREEEERKRREELAAKRKAEEEERRARKAAEDEARRAREEEARKAREEEERVRAEQEAEARAKAEFEAARKAEEDAAAAAKKAEEDAAAAKLAEEEAAAAAAKKAEEDAAAAKLAEEEAARKAEEDAAAAAKKAEEDAAAAKVAEEEAAAAAAKKAEEDAEMAELARKTRAALKIQCAHRQRAARKKATRLRATRDAAAEEKRRLAAEQEAEEKRKAEEEAAKKAEEEAAAAAEKAAAEQKAKEEEERHAKEVAAAAAAADAARKAAAEKALADAKAKAEAEAEARRKAEEEKRLAAEKAAAEKEAKRRADARKRLADHPHPPCQPHHLVMPTEKRYYADTFEVDTDFRGADKKPAPGMTEAEFYGVVDKLWPGNSHEGGVARRAWMYADKDAQQGLPTADAMQAGLQFIVYANNLRPLFENIDADGTGAISMDDFDACASQFEIDDSAQGWRDMAKFVSDKLDIAVPADACPYDLFVFFLSHNHPFFDVEVEVAEASVPEGAADQNASFTGSFEVQRGTRPWKARAPCEDLESIELPADSGLISDLFDHLIGGGSAAGVAALSLAQFREATSLMWPGFDQSQAIVKNAFDSVAADDAEQLVRRSKFARALQFLVYANNLNALLDDVDDDGNKKVSKKEFTAIASQFGIDETAAAAAFGELDHDGKKYVAFAHFIDWVMANRDAIQHGSGTYDGGNDDSPKEL